ncbi:uncharacterized protein LOC143582891 [Bidens hawaiensis]|uniref:uncharacterized protein LOC143582891 n=1 Tax=Bidens hawaiensis TaxID=980011 RepID=UPI00404B83B8
MEKIQRLGTALDLTLWNENCNQLSNYKKENPTIQPVVVILWFAKYKKWSGKASISNMFNGSKLLINTDSKEIQDLKQRIDCGSMSSQSLSCETVVHSIKNEFLVMNEFNCIAEINKLKKVQNVILLGTIKSIEKKKIHGIFLVALIVRVRSNRFQVIVTLQDSTGFCFLTLFDSVAIKFLNISSKDLMSLYGKDHTSDAFYPSELETLVDRKLAFKVQVTKYNQDKPSNYFKVLKNTDDAEVIEPLDKKDGDSFSFDNDDQQTINLKKTVSAFGMLCYDD